MSFIDITVSVDGVVELSKQLKDTGDRFDKRALDVTRHYGALLQADVRARAQQLFQVLDYSDRIQLRSGKGRIKVWADVWTDKPQAHRLEFGFTGTDSLGRHVHEAPRPHWRPAAEQIAQRYFDAILELLK